VWSLILETYKVFEFVYNMAATRNVYLAIGLTDVISNESL